MLQRLRRRADTTKPIGSLIKRSLLAWSLFSGLPLVSLGAELTTAKLAEGFANPSGDYRPWVWAHWLHGNVDRASITRELEAMKRAGLGGLTMFDVAQPGIPAGEHKYMQPSWQEMFGFEIAVVNLWANRLIGDAALPEDAKRNGEGKLEGWPQWVLAGGASPTGRRTFVTIPQYKKDDSLSASGLLGPVTLRTVE